MARFIPNIGICPNEEVQHVGTSQHKVVLIEDDQDIGALIAELLRGENYGVVHATSVQEGVTALAAGEFDLIITDAFVNHLEPSSKWTQLEQIRDAAQPLPTIICTAHAPTEFTDYADRGFAALLAKPFDLDDLLTLMERLLKNPTAKQTSSYKNPSTL